MGTGGDHPQLLRSVGWLVGFSSTLQRRKAICARNMIYSNQCQAAYTKAVRILGMINRTTKFKLRMVLLRVYKSLVRSHLEYCVSAWSPHYRKDKELLERVQHRFTRMIKGFPAIPYANRLLELDLWTLEEHRNIPDIIETYKILNGLTRVNPSDFFQLQQDDRTRGHPLKLSKNRYQQSCDSTFSRKG